MPAKLLALLDIAVDDLRRGSGDGGGGEGRVAVTGGWLSLDCSASSRSDSGGWKVQFGGKRAPRPSPPCFCVAQLTGGVRVGASVLYDCSNCKGNEQMEHDEFQQTEMERKNGGGGARCGAR